MYFFFKFFELLVSFILLSEAIVLFGITGRYTNDIF